MKYRLLSLVTLFFYSLSSYSQLNHTSLHLEVLNSNIKEQVFIFGKWNENNETETHLNYLGKVISNSQEEYKIMTSSWFWGPTKKSTNKILVYNNKNELLGKYYLDTTCWLPNKIENNKLIFNTSECNGCDKASTEISFNDGIPNAFFISCKPSSGNIFSFYSI